MESTRHDENALMTALESWGRGEDWEAGMADASPAIMDRLRRDLAAAVALRQDLPEPSPAAEARSRTAWLAAGAELRARRQAPATATGRTRWWAGGLPNRRPAWLAAGLAAWLTLGGGAVWAAERSLPGDNLYPIKTWHQEVRIAVARSPEARVRAIQAQEDSYRRDCLAVLAEGREVEVEFFGRLERADGPVWFVGGLPVDVSSADLSAVLVSATPLEGRRLQVDARTEGGRLIALRVLPAEPLPAVSPSVPDEGIPSGNALGIPLGVTPGATASAAADTLERATEAALPAADEGSDDPGSAPRPSTADVGDTLDEEGGDDKSGDDEGGGDEGGDDKGGDDEGGDDEGGDDKGGDDKGGGDKGGGDEGGDDEGGDDEGGDDEGGDDEGGDDKG